MTAGKRIRRPNTAGRIAYRFVSGRLLSGEPATDSTYLFKARNVYKTNGTLTWWAKGPGWHRQFTRTGIIGTVSCAVYGYVTHPLLTEISAGSIGTTGIASASVLTWRSRQRHKHERDWQKPLNEALAEYLYPDKPVPRRIAEVPQDVHETGEVRINLPGYLSTAKRVEVLDIVASKLGMTDVDTVHYWHMAGRNQHLTMHRLPMPPSMVSVTDAEKLLLEAKPSAPILGVGRNGIPIAVDLDSEAPHFLLSAGTGAGKSTIIRALIAQCVRHGSQIELFDIKRHSHRWAKEVLNISYYRDIEPIHDRLVALGEELYRRNIASDDLNDGETLADPRIIAVIEEMNVLLPKLINYWAEVRESSDPKTSPAIQAYRDLLAAGRAVRMHVFGITQSATVRAVGGPEARENFGCRVLARTSANGWKMLAPEVSPVPKQSKHRGRFHVVMGDGNALLCQGVFFTDVEAVEWCSRGTVSVPRDWVVETEAERVPLLTLPEIAREGFATYDALRKLRMRRDDFPKPRARRGTRNLYHASDIREFYKANVRNADL